MITICQCRDQSFVSATGYNTIWRLDLRGEETAQWSIIICKWLPIARCCTDQEFSNSWYSFSGFQSLCWSHNWWSHCNIFEDYAVESVLCACRARPTWIRRPEHYFNTSLTTRSTSKTIVVKGWLKTGFREECRLVSRLPVATSKTTGQGFGYATSAHISCRHRQSWSWA